MRIALLLLSLIFSTAYADITSFGQAKKLLKEHVYYDTMHDGTFYCGCDWEWVGATGGRVDLNSCGYKVRKNQVRAERTEWEHVVPAWVLGHQRQCWQNGGRENCINSDSEFRKMEADPHNLHIAIGEVNADRSNFSFAMLPWVGKQHGQCDVKVDFKGRAVEPRNEVKGQIARIYFYMHDRYNLSMSRQQQQLFMAWDKQFPVTESELERDRRISKIAGNSNPFVTGDKEWQLGKKPAVLADSKPDSNNPMAEDKKATSSPIKGNRGSKIYHVFGCGSYDKLNPANIVYFDDEQAAIAKGFRKAKNCP